MGWARCILAEGVNLLKHIKISVSFHFQKSVSYDEFQTAIGRCLYLLEERLENTYYKNMNKLFQIFRDSSHNLWGFRVFGHRAHTRAHLKF